MVAGLLYKLTEAMKGEDSGTVTDGGMLKPSSEGGREDGAGALAQLAMREGKKPSTSSCRALFDSC